MKEKLRRRLTMYWQLELLNAAALPSAAVFFSFAQGPLGVASILALIPMTGLLIAGGLYWRSKLHEITLKEAPDRTVAILARLQLPLLILTIAGALAASVSVALPSARASAYDAIIASAAATLALLEYVNYYHIQLQHFDNWADFMRLITGRGFRRSKLSDDMARLRG
jgi:hypothetical protein